MYTLIGQLQHVFEDAPFGACVLDVDGIIVYVNRSFASTIKTGDIPITGKSAYDLIHDFLQDEGLALSIRRLLKTDEPFSQMIETLSSPKIKTPEFMNFFGYRLERVYILIADFVSGSFVHQSWYKKLIHDAPDAILIMKNGVIIFCNPAFSEIVQKPPGKILGKEIYELIDKKSMGPLLTLRQDRIKGFSSRINIRTKTDKFVLEGKFHSIEDRPGTSIAMLRDVTEKVALEQRLIRQNQDLAVINLISETLSSSIHLEEILQSTLVKVLQIMNVEAGWIYLLDEANQTLKCAYSYGLPDYFVQSIKQLALGEGIAGRVVVNGEPIILENASEDPRVKSLVIKQQGIQSFASIPLKSRTRMIGAMNIGSFGQRIISPDDKRLLMNIGLHMGAVIENVLLFKEVTNTSEELMKALNIIEQRNDELRNLIYTVSHDLKNPIIAINGFARRLTKEVGSKLSNKAMDYLKAITESGIHMEKFVTNLLTLSTVEQLKIEKEQFDAREVIEDVLRELIQQLEEKNGEIKIDDNLPVIFADRIRITQVFSNFISNAIKYAHPDRDLELNIGYERKNTMHVFFVKDNGIGIPAEHVRSVFDMFYRAYENVAEGTGMGLSIAKKAVNMMGGYVWLESQRGIGSTFYFSIPFR